MSKRPAWWMDFLKIYWPLQLFAAKITNIPILGKLFLFCMRPVFSEKNFSISYIPVNIKVEGLENTVLPEKIMEILIKNSAHRIIIKRCSCRDLHNCKNFPIEDSCLLLGQDTITADETVAKHVSVEEALKHMHAKTELGLIPMTGRVRMDDFFYGLPNTGRMLTICFCCPCCCTVLASMKYLTNSSRKSVNKINGLKINLHNESCALCGQCISVCPASALFVFSEKIHWNENKCIGCGICVRTCRQSAVSIEINDIEKSADMFLNMIQKKINIT